MFSSKTKRVSSLALCSLALSLTTSGMAYSCPAGTTIYTAFTSARLGQTGQQARGWYSLFSTHQSNLSREETLEMAEKMSLDSCHPAQTAQSDIVALMQTPEFPSSAYPCAQAEIYNGLISGGLAYKAWLGKAPLLPNSLLAIQTLMEVALTGKTEAQFLIGGKIATQQEAQQLIGKIEAQQSAYADACANAFCSALGGQELTVGLAQSISKNIYTPHVNLTSAPAGQSNPVPGGTGFCDPAMPKQQRT